MQAVRASIRRRKQWKSMSIVYILMAAVGIWFIVEERRGRALKVRKTAEALWAGFGKSGDAVQLPDIAVASAADLEGKYSREYAEWENAAVAAGFTLLGNLLTQPKKEGSTDYPITKVMVDPSSETILAFSMSESHGVAAKNTEVESQLESGDFLYSTDNKLTYCFRQPESIRLNVLAKGDIQEQVAGHRKFAAQFQARLRPYPDIQSVIDRTLEQSKMRAAFRKTLEFPILEEELVALAHDSKKNFMRQVYQEMKKLGDKEAVK
jgi:hypothetical protein